MREHAGWCPYTVYSPVKCEQLFISNSLTTNKVKLFSLLGPISHSNVQDVRDNAHQTYKQQVGYSHLKGFCAPLYLMGPILGTTKEMEAQTTGYISDLSKPSLSLRNM